MNPLLGPLFVGEVAPTGTARLTRGCVATAVAAMPLAAAFVGDDAISFEWKREGMAGSGDAGLRLPPAWPLDHTGRAPPTPVPLLPLLLPDADWSIIARNGCMGSTAPAWAEWASAVGLPSASSVVRGRGLCAASRSVLVLSVVRADSELDEWRARGCIRAARSAAELQTKEG